MASTQSLMWKLPPGTHNLAVGTNLRGSMVGGGSSRRQADSEGSQPSTEYLSMRYNFKPPAVANAGGVIQQAASSNEYQMQLTSETGEQHSFTATASQPKKDVECVIFYDPVTKLLVIERLDHLLTVTHQRGSSATTPLSTFTAHTQPPTEKQQPALANISQHQPHPQQRPLTTRTAPPIPSSRSLPTPPSTSPPDFASLPAVRNAALPRKPARAAQPPEEAPAAAPVTQTSFAVSGRSSTSAHSAPSLAHIALPPLHTTSKSTHGNISTPQSQPASLSEFAKQQHALEAQAADGCPEVSNNGFASNHDDMYDLDQPTSANALQLSTSSTSSLKRPREEEEESDPDEEELHFGRRTRQIKRVKTSQSPASGSDATPLTVPTTGYRSTPGVTNNSYTSPFGVRPEAPSLIHGHSPLAQSFSPKDESQEQPPPQSQVQYVQEDDEDDEEEDEENSDSDSDSTDSDDEVLHPPIQQDTYVYTVPDPNPIVYHNEEEDDSDEDEEDDFLMQALGESGGGVGRGSGTTAASEYYSGDDDSSDNSDYGEH